MLFNYLSPNSELFCCNTKNVKLCLKSRKLWSWLVSKNDALRLGAAVFSGRLSECDHWSCPGS